MIADSKTPRRKFLGKLAAGAGTAIALPALLNPLDALATTNSEVSPVEADRVLVKQATQKDCISDAHQIMFCCDL